MRFDERAKASFVAELARTGRICDALEAAGVTYRTYRKHLRHATFASAVTEAATRWAASNDALARQERTQGLERYRAKHPRRLAELGREGLVHWRKQNPGRAAAVIRRAADAAKAKLRKELSPIQLQQAESLLRRGLGYRRTAHVLRVNHITLWRRMREIHAVPCGAGELS